MTQFLAATSLLDATTTALEKPSRLVLEALTELIHLKSRFTVARFTPRYDDQNGFFLDSHITCSCTDCGESYDLNVSICRHEGELWGAFIEEDELGGKAERQFMSATAAYLAILDELPYYRVHKCEV